ncbi:hypothetical protein M426DRAFT_326201 [Hypoxylon sp. CI-4A]|nr:hypothetical protein M426DRAFT_326201 [Hypoxylon sp. CI-4A]
MQVNQSTELLERRIKAKTEDITSLRDALFNASSLLEASRATQMNRYVIVFTIVTVIFLPPSFVATLFGTDLFNEGSQLPSITKFQILTVVVSLGTYTIAFILIRIADSLDTLQRALKRLPETLLSLFPKLIKYTYDHLKHWAIVVRRVLHRWARQLRQWPRWMMTALRNLWARRREDGDEGMELPVRSAVDNAERDRTIS